MIGGAKFNSEDLHYQIAFGCRPSQLSELLSTFNPLITRAVDVGSGTAQHAIAISSFAPASSVYAVEPDSIMCNHARRNIIENHAKNIFLRRIFD